MENKTEEHQTIIERFNNADEEEQIRLASIITSNRMKEAGMDVVRKRRHEYASTLSVGTLDHSEVVDHIAERELDFLDEYWDEEVKNQLPEWLLRAEAQDIVLEKVYEKFKENNLLK